MKEIGPRKLWPFYDFFGPDTLVPRPYRDLKLEDRVQNRTETQYSKVKTRNSKFQYQNFS